MLVTPPIRGPIYRLSPEESLGSQLDEMLDDGRIEPSCSPWASPVMMVPKAGKCEYRLCRLSQIESTYEN